MTRLRHGDIDVAAELLASAFLDQPYEMYYEPDGPRRLQLLRQAFSHHVRECVENGEPLRVGEPLVGVALVTPPHTGPPPAGERPDSRTDWVEIFGEAAQARATPLRDTLRLRHEQDMTGPHWYLSILGVAPSQQGGGVGGALLRTVLPRARSDGLPCHLDTAQPRNVGFYLAHGFEILNTRVEPVSGLRYWTFKAPSSDATPRARPMEIVPVRFPPDILAAVREWADEEDRSVSNWIRRAVEHELADSVTRPIGQTSGQTNDDKRGRTGADPKVR